MTQGACPHCMDFYGVTPIGLLLDTIAECEDQGKREMVVKAAMFMFAYMNTNQIMFYKELYEDMSETTDKLLEKILQQSRTLQFQSRLALLKLMVNNYPTQEKLEQLVTGGLITEVIFQYVNMSSLE